MHPSLELADYRRRTAALHLDGPVDGEAGAAAFRQGRDALFARHPQSPLTAEQRETFAGLPHFPYDPEARIEATPAAAPDAGELEVDTGGPDGMVRLRRAARLRFARGELTLFWIAGYGGGLFLPFKDGTSGEETYGGGRYLTDTIKGTWGRGVSLEGDRVLLDFNYAYNPSCAYNATWACPLAPPENRLEAPIRAGELVYPDPA